MNELPNEHVFRKSHKRNVVRTLEKPSGGYEGYETRTSRRPSKTRCNLRIAGQSFGQFHESLGRSFSLYWMFLSFCGSSSGKNRDQLKSIILGSKVLKLFFAVPKYWRFLVAKNFKKPTLKNICLPRFLAMVKEVEFLAYLSRFQAVGLLQHFGKNTGSLAVPFSITCQINLTKIRIWVENIDKTSHFQKMEKSKGAALGAMMLGTAMVSPEFAAAAEKTNPDVKLAALSTTGQVKDACVTSTIEKRLAAKKQGLVMSRAEVRKLLNDCQTGNISAEIEGLDKTIEKQEETLRKQKLLIAKLTEHAKSLDMQINENREILDKNGNILGRIIEEGGKLRIVRAEAEQELAKSKVRLAKAQQKYAQKLDQFEKYLVSQR